VGDLIEKNEMGGSRDSWENENFL